MATLPTFNASPDVTTFTGPEVDGSPTTITMFSPAQLTGSPFLPGLHAMINAAFAASHASMPELEITGGNRLGSVDEFLVNLRDDPETFVAVVHRPSTYDVVATGSCRRWHGPFPDSTSPFMRRTAPASGTEEWELKLMAVGPAAQGQGMGGYLVKLAEEEVARRFRSKLKGLEPQQNSPQRLRMVMCTIKELKENFYARRGYIEDYEVSRGEGYKYNIIFMSKDITSLCEGANGS